MGRFRTPAPTSGDHVAFSHAVGNDTWLQQPATASKRSGLPARSPARSCPEIEGRANSEPGAAAPRDRDRARAPTMMSRGNGGTPRRERKRKTGGRTKQGGGVSAGWKKPVHPALAKVDPALLSSLGKWSAERTLAHQFRIAATPAVPAPPLPHVPPEPEPKTPAPGLAAVKHAQELERRAALMFEAKNTAQAFTRQYAAASSLGELY